ncbi:hypothetical protein SAMN05660413_03336 [Salegentibacter flavus]|uniref:Uncharacterized protein n=2 Tax=Flavobacteriaceae TaxID=49546 RepID=A0A1I5DHK1_9FLAO|nr:hypothetical protein SAMN05660413_03336 [Salegentibacter flavus]
MKVTLNYSLLYIFLMATLFHSVRFTFLVSFYTLNNESFTELFCENKDKPELECNGKCSITKAGKDLNQEKDNQALNSFQKEITLYVNFLVSENSFDLPETCLPNFQYLNFYSFLFAEQITPPPMGIS